MKLRKIISLLIMVVIMFEMSGCVNQRQENKKQNTYEQPRIVATSPAVAQICSRLNLELVGVCQTNSALPDEYKNLPQVGMAMNPDLEIIKSLNPTYVFSPATLQNDLKPKYDAAGLNSIFLNLKSLEGMYVSIEKLGKMFNREKEAAEMRAEYETFISEYTEKNIGKKSPRVLVLMGLPGSYIVATESSYVGSIVKLAGGVNIYGDGDGEEFLNANTEDMKIKDPDIILCASHGLPDQVKDMFVEEFKINDIWKHFSAVQNHRIYYLDSDLFNMSASFNYPDAFESLQPMLYG